MAEILLVFANFLTGNLFGVFFLGLFVGFMLGLSTRATVMIIKGLCDCFKALNSIYACALFPSLVAMRFRKLKPATKGIQALQLKQGDKSRRFCPLCSGIFGAPIELRVFAPHIMLCPKCRRTFSEKAVYNVTFRQRYAPRPPSELCERDGFEHLH